MKKTYIAPSIKVKKMETTGELLAGSYEAVVHEGGSLHKASRIRLTLPMELGQRRLTLFGTATNSK